MYCITGVFFNNVSDAMGQAETQFGCQEYCSMANNDRVAASSGRTALSETVNLVMDAPDLAISGYCTCYKRMLDAHRFAEVFWHGRSKTMVGYCSMRHGTDTNA